MNTANYMYYHEGQALSGFLAMDQGKSYLRPAVIVAHDWSGRNPFACQKAEMLAEIGYIGFALDMYGDGRVGETTDEKMALMQPLVQDRVFLRERIRTAFDAVSTMPEVDSTRIAAIGFCFGGLCVLDLARSGVNIRGVVSFHGLLGRAKELPPQKILSKVLALHGYNDPMATPSQLEEFCQEMTESEVDWQVHQYGLTQHAFTNPLAHDHNLGLVYNQQAEKRSMLAMKNFLQEIFV